MIHDLRLVCDRCQAFRPFHAAWPLPVAMLRAHAVLGPFVIEHEDCQPPLRIAGADDEAVEAYRENYEET